MVPGGGQSGRTAAGAASGWQRLPGRWQWRLTVLLGGLLGASIRVGLEMGWSTSPDAWPWPTFLVNMAGAFALGLLLPHLARLRGTSSLLLPLIAIGLLGALTTFSLLIYEAWLLVDHDRVALAAAYLTVTVGAGLSLAIAGDRIAAVTGRERGR